MELRTTREMRRNEQLSRTAAKKADTESAAAKAQAQPAQRLTQAADKLTLSRQALDWVEERQRQMWEPVKEEYQPHDPVSSMLESLESKKQELEGLSEKLDILDKCQKIAASIMKGDNVPPEDMVYLMEHDQAGFKLAMAMRKTKEDPEDVKSVLDDEGKNGGSADGAEGSGETAPVSASEGFSGGEASASAE